MLPSAEHLAQQHHAEANPLAMGALTFSPTERALLAAMDAILGRQQADRERIDSLQTARHGE